MPDYITIPLALVAGFMLDIVAGLAAVVVFVLLFI